MKYQIDQSGKLEQLNTHTVVAFSNDDSGAVALTVTAKRSVIMNLRKSIIPHKNLLPIWFSIVIFILLENISPHAVLVIDEEYTGNEALIKETLTKLFDKKFKKGWKGSIRFKNIGKSSPAHQLAWGLHRKKRGLKVRKITYKEIMRYVK
jgi:hypothetical protein